VYDVNAQGQFAIGTMSRIIVGYNPVALNPFRIIAERAGNPAWSPTSSALAFSQGLSLDEETPQYIAIQPNPFADGWLQYPLTTHPRPMDAAYASQPISWALLLWLQLSLPATATAQAQATATAQVQTTATQTAIAMLTAAPTITPTRQATVFTPDCDYNTSNLGTDFRNLGGVAAMEGILGAHTRLNHIDGPNATPMALFNRALSDLRANKATAFWSLYEAEQLVETTLNINTGDLTLWADSANNGDVEPFRAVVTGPLNSRTVTVPGQPVPFPFTNTVGFGFYRVGSAGRGMVYAANTGPKALALNSVEGRLMCEIVLNPFYLSHRFPFVLQTAFPR
jgi:hypothetical protein